VRRRESLETVGMFVWGGLSQAAGRSGRQPTSLVLALQAPVAGVILDDVLKGTILDRMLQPFARGGKRSEALLALVGPPLLVELMVRHPEWQPQILPMLAAALESYADIAGPKVAAAKKRAEKRAADIGADGGIQGLLEWIFAPPDQAPGSGEGAAAAA